MQVLISTSDNSMLLDGLKISGKLYSLGSGQLLGAF